MVLNIQNDLIFFYFLLNQKGKRNNSRWWINWVASKDIWWNNIAIGKKINTDGYLPPSELRSYNLNAIPFHSLAQFQILSILILDFIDGNSDTHHDFNGTCTCLSGFDYSKIEKFKCKRYTIHGQRWWIVVYQYIFIMCTIW